ncbi:MAG TPA: hypothetical protein EYP60_05405 [bacterium (Candidatus Stahlbacteria)]|nr:hypothetical protein [Candidatus Stahlbacteria bacterium]
MVENNYIDRDYRDEFSFLYSKTFKNYDSRCIRLHLFQTEYAKIDEIKNLGYLGYIIMRPIDVGNVGRTVIYPWIIDPNKYYYLCTASFKTHLFGKELSVSGTPFIQQDTMVIRCAQASIWIALRFMKQAYDFPTYLPSQITISATKYLAWAGRTVPSEGLTAQQIVTALNSLNYSPLLFTKQQFQQTGGKWEPVKLIYKYIESQIPVIAVVPQHAITIIGHTFDPKPRSLLALIGQEKVVSSDNWVSGFIVHDDSLGPYRILPSAQYINQFKTGKEADLLPPEKWLYKSIDDIQAIIVPLPPKVYYPGSSVDTITQLIQVRTFLSFVYKSAVQGHQIAREFLSSLEPQMKNPLVLRSYFTLSEKYKKNLNKEPLCKEIAPTIRWEYKKMKMPRFIWVVEITNTSRFSKEN